MNPDGKGYKIPPFAYKNEEEKETVEKVLAVIQGTCQGADMEFELIRSPTGRSFCKVDSKTGKVTIAIREFTDSWTFASSLIHEIGHMIEDTKPGVQKIAREFQEHRLGDEKPVDMGDVTGGTMRGELGRKDQFERFFDEQEAYYIGKEYRHPKTGEVFGTEILSMGIEAMIQDPAGFINADPEYAAMVIHAMRSPPEEEAAKKPGEKPGEKPASKATTTSTRSQATAKPAAKATAKPESSQSVQKPAAQKPAVAKPAVQKPVAKKPVVTPDKTKKQ